MSETIKFKDLELAVNYIKANSVAETVTFRTHYRSGIELEFTDHHGNCAVIHVYNFAVSVTPQITKTTNLYANKVIAE